MELGFQPQTQQVEMSELQTSTEHIPDTQTVQHVTSDNIEEPVSSEPATLMTTAMPSTSMANIFQTP